MPIFDFLDFINMEYEYPLAREVQKYCLKREDNEEKLISMVQKEQYSPNILMDKGRKPIHYLTLFGKVKVLREFIRAGADVNAKDEQNFTPLIIAVCRPIKESPQIVEALFYSGANAMCCLPESSDSPLSIAVKKNYYGLVNNFTRNIDVNTPIYKGHTLLHIAAWWNSIESAKILLMRGADLRIKNNRGQTAYKVASIRGNTRMVNFLTRAESTLGKMKMAQAVNVLSKDPKNLPVLQSLGANMRLAPSTRTTTSRSAEHNRELTERLRTGITTLAVTNLATGQIFRPATTKTPDNTPKSK